MFRKMLSFAGLLLLAVAVVSATPSPGQARGGGGHRGGFQGGGGHGGGFHGGWHGSWPSWHGSWGWQYSPGWRGYYGGYPYYYGGYYPYYGYYPYLYGGNYPLENAYANDTPLLTNSLTSAPAPIDNTAHITVRVPAEAQVSIEGSKTASTGAVRQLVTPPLTPGSRYAYHIETSWEENGHKVKQMQYVEVTAGDRINVAFPIEAPGPVEHADYR